MTRLLFYVQHVKGVGHVFRTARIVRALIRDGFDVTVVTGGLPIVGMDFYGARVEQLPPVRAADGVFNALVDANGTPVTDTIKAERRDRLLAVFDQFQPDVLMTETFPLGRRVMRFELLPLMERAASASPRPLIVGSVRDILQVPSSPERADWQMGLLRTYFDHLLVHGDAQFARVEESYPPTVEIGDRLHYTGLVAPEPDPAPLPARERVDVVVSAGGGAIGHDLLRTAIAAKSQTRLANDRWLLLSGAHMPDSVEAELQEGCKLAGIRHETFRSDVARTLRTAKLSIQMCGYNTVCDALVAHCRSVVVPFDDGNETEQLMRAEKLAAHGLARVQSPETLSVENLANAIDEAANLDAPNTSFDLNGAENTAHLLRTLLAGRS
ncbi:MAG: glycosyltransferase [Pseudomonadota bacterium]